MARIVQLIIIVERNNSIVLEGYRNYAKKKGREKK